MQPQSELVDVVQEPAPGGQLREACMVVGLVPQTVKGVGQLLRHHEAVEDHRKAKATPEGGPVGLIELFVLQSAPGGADPGQELLDGDRLVDVVAAQVQE